LLDELDRLDLWKTTLVVLLGDNGFHLGDHGGLWAKLSASENSTRVPLILSRRRRAHGSQHHRAGRVALDVYPTLADYAGFTCTSRPGGTLAAGADRRH
jgi:arylsulfatase A-like enzyme